jgi:ferric-dicitrate binding protein FerR (iron transport regulator)
VRGWLWLPSGIRRTLNKRSRTSLAFSGRNFARLDPNTSLDCVNLSGDRTQLALREGSALFDVGYLPSGGLFEVGSPYGAVEFQEPGLYHMRLDNGNAIVSVLSGLAQVVGQGSSGRISKGEMLTILAG